MNATLAQTTVTDIGLDIAGLITAYAGEAGTLLMAVLGIGLAFWLGTYIGRKLRAYLDERELRKDDDWVR